LKVLVVDDETISLKLAQLVLSADGNEVSQATVALRAIEEILRSAPEVILLDLGLPGIDGLMLTRHLKRDPRTRHIVIIAITAFPEMFTREAAMAAECDAYLVKPINTRLLAQQVAAALANAK